MANYRAVATGNWSAGATWAGGAVPPNAAGHSIYSNGFTVTIDQNVNVALITNALNTGTFVGGGTAAAGGGFSMPNAFNVTSNVASSTATCLTISASTGTITMSGSSLSTGATASTSAVLLTSTATLNMTGYTCSPPLATFSYAVALSGNGTINLTSFIVNGSGGAGTIYNINNSSSSGTINFYTSTISPSNTICVLNNATGFMSFTNCIINGAGSSTAIGISNSATITVTGGNVNAGAGGVAISSNGTLIVTGASINATNGASAISASGTARISGTFVNATNGQQAIFSSRWILNTAPTASYIQQALDGINTGSYVRFYTADNSLTQANPTDVRTGVSYAAGNLTGRLTVPACGSVALSVNYGPSMPFTATLNGTTATATLAYSYPLVVGDSITVTGASNTEWNSTYTIASVVSGTSVTFIVPATHSATAGSGATMQTTGTAVLDPAAVASAVWGAASRTITGGTVTTLTNSPNVPSAAAIADEVRVELATELGRIDAPISGATAPSAATVATSVRTELATELARLAQCSTVATTGAQLAAALS